MLSLNRCLYLVRVHINRTSSQTKSAKSRMFCKRFRVYCVSQSRPPGRVATLPDERISTYRSLHVPAAGAPYDRPRLMKCFP